MTDSSIQLGMVGWLAGFICGVPACVTFPNQTGERFIQIALSANGTLLYLSHSGLQEQSGIRIMARSISSDNADPRPM